NPIDANFGFDLVPDTAIGTRKAKTSSNVYLNFRPLNVMPCLFGAAGDSPGELSGCWNDVLNMNKYTMEENAIVLMDGGEHTEPTCENIVDAYWTVVLHAKDRDVICLHHSGHGTKLRDGNSDEEDGYDETLLPHDFQMRGTQLSGMIRDDDLYKILIKGLPDGEHMVSLVDCCHS
ncbi:hypothetical protein ACHAWF_013513, partial [Thalassiosira exigua]